MSTDDGRIAAGGYQNLLSYQKAIVIYDLTELFIGRFLSADARTADQMRQAARSGKQNIVEGSATSGTSKEGELLLTGVADASLKELLEDYSDYLRARRLPVWDKDSEQCAYVRTIGRDAEGNREKFLGFARSRTEDVVANIAICLIHQATYLLRRQIVRLQADYEQLGGTKERLAELHRKYREAVKSDARESFLKDLSERRAALDKCRHQAEEMVKRKPR